MSQEERKVNEITKTTTIHWRFALEDNTLEESSPASVGAGTAVLVCVAMLVSVVRLESSGGTSMDLIVVLKHG